jgi:demethylmenaquinone methyltransferase/2-methoxy-6-polyprenyl-1,4-benzoquinol methylase
MDSGLRRRMLHYYDERASTYEEAYVLGTGTSSIPDPSVFQVEAALLGDVVRRFVQGRVVDLACGTAYWLPHYAQRCSSITLFDQSENMLDQCRGKVAALGIADRCSVVRGDVFDYQFNPAAYDSALVGFLMSHVTEAQEELVFALLRNVLAPGGRFLILDSAWSAARARFNAKAERQLRRLNDGTTFEIYKRYFDEQDIAAWANKYGATLSIEHFGAAFLSVSGSFLR